jgi:hypothetical protein
MVSNGNFQYWEEIQNPIEKEEEGSEGQMLFKCLNVSNKK